MEEEEEEEEEEEGHSAHSDCTCKRATDLMKERKGRRGEGKGGEGDYNG